MVFRENDISSGTRRIFKKTVTGEKRTSRREIMSNAAERIPDVEHIAPLLRREGIGGMTCVRARVRITILGPA